MTKLKINKKIVIIVLSILLLGIAFVTLEKMEVIDLFNKKSGIEQTTGPTKEEKQAEAQVDADAKKEFIEGETNKNTSTPTEPSSIELSARKETNGTVTVFTKLYGIASGNCKLTVTNASSSTTQNAEVIYQPEYSICGGFSVPVSGLNNGSWNISLSVNSNGKSQTKAIPFDVK